MRYLYFLGAVLAIGATPALAQQYYAPQPAPVQPQPMAAPMNNGMAPAQAAPGAAIDSVGEGAIPALPSLVQQSGDVTFINGGISDEDVAELKAKSGQFNLHLLISAVTGEYISDVKLRVLDSNGNAVLTIDDAGPYVYAQLKPGSYTLEAATASGTKSLRVRVPAKGSIKQHIAFKESN
jgi:hypothetical protein